MKEATIRRWAQVFRGWKVWQVLALMVVVLMALAATVAMAGGEDRR